MKYNYQILKIDGLDNSFDILNKYLDTQGPGKYKVTIEKDDGIIVKKEDD